MTIKAVVFDLDGTLVDTAPDLMAATNHVLALLKRRPITMPEVRAFVGRGARKLIERGVAATGEAIDEASLTYYHAEFLRHYEGHTADRSEIFPGAVALLERLEKSGIKAGVCTNKPEGLSRLLLDTLDLSRFLGAVVGPDTIGIGKPDAAPYLETVKRLGVAPQHSILVGDSEIDILTAHAAGVPIVAVSFGYTAKPIIEYGPDHLVSHFDEIWDILNLKR
ncbi:MAG TPA: phosphoglycolate phosphatase [Aestuariivirga sp.]|jgi:phosphoglycolate phosphatase|nr:phosphoglycolate phosphatase [Aestuariivirga sp.]